MMTESLFERVVAPVETSDDARATATALYPFVRERAATVTAVHVVEPTSGAPDASVPDRKQATDDIFAPVTDGLCDTDATVDTTVRYEADAAASIVEVAHDRNATAVVFTPRGGSRWRKLLTGDTTDGLVESTAVPIVVLPDRAVSNT